MLFLAPPSWRAVRGRRREREERREVEEEEEERQEDEEERRRMRMRRRRRRRRGSRADFNCSIHTKVSAVGILLDRDRGKNGSPGSFFSAGETTVFSASARSGEHVITGTPQLHSWLLILF